MRWLWTIALSLPLLGSAQQASTVVGVDLDSATIRIGEQVRLQLHVAYAPGQRTIEWPAVPDPFGPHIEVVHDTGIDTLHGDGGLDRQVRTLTLTSFDSGFWAIPPFRFVVDGSPLESQALLLEVRTVPVDSAMTLREIKDIHTLPFSTWYWVRAHKLWLLGSLAVVIALAVLIVLYRKRRPSAPIAVADPAVPLDQRVLQALDALEKERLWQQGEHKGYHSRLTDLLRGYIEERYKVQALESTTDELIQELRVGPLNNDRRTQLENMLRLADMVKFAKTIPTPAENEQMMVGAVRFIQETRRYNGGPDHG